jgi:hypothetical protein
MIFGIVIAAAVIAVAVAAETSSESAGVLLVEARYCATIQAA